MNKFESERKFVQRTKETYPPGTRLLLLSMDDPYHPVQSGTRGTVVHVDDMAQIHMRWDNGRTLAIDIDADTFRKLTATELAEEEKAMREVFAKLSDDELFDRDIMKFESFDDFFDFIYDENTTKEDLINDMSSEMKKELVSNNYSERFLCIDGEYYYNSEGDFDVSNSEDEEQQSNIMGM